MDEESVRERAREAFRGEGTVNWVLEVGRKELIN